MVDFQDLITTEDVCTMFGKSVVTISTWRRDSGFPTVVIPGKQRNTIRFDPEAVKKWAKAHGKLLKGQKAKRRSAKSKKTTDNSPKDDKKKKKNKKKKK